MNPNLKNSLISVYKDKLNTNQEIFYIERKRMVPFTSEIKRVILALQSRILPEVRYALNSLLIYSCSKHSPFYLENYRVPFNEFKTYLLHLIHRLQSTKYIVKDREAFVDENLVMRTEVEGLDVEEHAVGSSELLEQLKICLTIIRNFSMVKTNEAFLAKENRLKTVFVDLLLFNNESEVNRLVLEIFAVLSKYTILNVKENARDKLFFQKIIDSINSDYSEEYELGIENLHNLMMNQENETVLEHKLPVFVDQLVKFLISNSSDMVERVLEIICHFSDLKVSTRVLLAKQGFLFTRLIALLAGSLEKNNDKVGKICVIILNNLMITPATRSHLKFYEKDLFMIATASETL